MNLNYPVVETSERIESSDNNFALSEIAYKFFEIFEPEIKQLFRWS